MHTHSSPKEGKKRDKSIFFLGPLLKLVVSPKGQPTVRAPKVALLPPPPRMNCGRQDPMRWWTSNGPWAPDWCWLGGGH